MGHPGSRGSREINREGQQLTRAEYEPSKLRLPAVEVCFLPAWAAEGAIFRARQSARLKSCPPERLRHHRLILLVHALEVGDLVIALKVPDPRRHFVDQVFVMRDQKHRPMKLLERDV